MRVIRSAIWCSVLWVGLAWGQIYQWTDTQGTVHFTDDPSRIPPAYRSKVQVQQASPSPEPSASPTPDASARQSPAGTPVHGGETPSTEPKDLLGRGADYWQQLAKKWVTSLRTNQQEHERLQLLHDRLRAIADKTRDVWDRGRLEAEIAQLEQGMAEAGARIREAQTMLQTTLPAEALRLGANPNWLKEPAATP